MSLIIDASAIGPILLPDEQHFLTAALQDRLASDDLLVPRHWFAEVANLLLVALRRTRIRQEDLAIAQATLSALSIVIDDGFGQQTMLHLIELSRENNLTVYDGAYLELARRRSLPLATHDKALIAAASANSVELFGR